MIRASPKIGRQVECLQAKRTWKDRWRSILQSCVLLGVPVTAHGACSVSTQPVNFGTYDTFDAAPTDSTGAVDVSCDASTAYTIALSPGGNSSFAPRRMSSGPHMLDYNLYLDASRVTIWGDGSAGTAAVSNTATTATHSVYGQIPARQNAYVGSYADTITVTVSF